MINKENVKKLIPQVLKVLAFALVFVVLIQVLSVTVFNGTKISQVSKKRACAYSFIEDPENTTDVVCLGSSDIWSGFVPTELWEKYGYTSVVSSFSHQSVADAQSLLEQIVKTQSPKLVILEVDTLYDGRGPEDVIKPHDTSLEYFFDLVEPDAFENMVMRDNDIFTFHNIWKDHNKKSKRREFAHGHLYNNTVEKIKYSDYMAKTDERDIPIYTNSQQLRAFAKYCKENDLNVLFLEIPSVSSWTYARHNAVQDLSDELGVELLDLNLLYDEIGIDMRNCYRDTSASHLNYAAACKVTDYVGKYIGENYGIESRRDDAELAEHWDNDVAEFKKLNKIKQDKSK